MTAVGRRDDGTFAPREPVAVQLRDAVTLLLPGVPIVLGALDDARAHRVAGAHAFNQAVDQLRRVLADGPSGDGDPGPEPIAVWLGEGAVWLDRPRGTLTVLIALRLQIRHARRDGRTVLTVPGAELYGVLTAALTCDQGFRSETCEPSLLDLVESAAQFPTGDEFLSASEAAEVLQVSHQMVIRLCGSGKLPASLRRGRWEIGVRDVVEAAARRRRAQHGVHTSTGAA